MPAPRPVPLRSTSHHRLAEQGRIKFGVRVPSSNRSGKGDGTRPKAIPWFRFTSKDRTAIEQLAALYGGQVLPWEDGFKKAAWQVTTEATRIRIVLPDEPFGDGPWYEYWDGGYCQRRCDGQTVQVSRATGPESADVVTKPCMCTERLVCRPTTRLHVALPELTPFVGFWRLETHSDNALREMPAAAAMILEAQGRGLSFGFLTLDERSQQRWDERQQKWHVAHFTVPVLAPATSFDSLIAGGSRAHALGPAAARPALAAGPAVSSFDPGPEQVSDDEAGDDQYPDDDYEDAEIVEDDMAAVGARPAPAPAHRPQSDEDAAQEASYRARKQRRIHARAVTRNRELYEACVLRVSDGRTRTSKELTLAELDRLDTLTEEWAKGKLDVTFDDGGELRIEAR